MSDRRRIPLSPSLKAALVILLEDGPARHDTSFWVSPRGRSIRTVTIDALYDRYLIKIVVESKYRRRHSAKLTDVGEYAALEIQRQFSAGIAITRNTPRKISEEAARFITENVS